MANSEMNRLRELSEIELNDELKGAKQELFNLKFQWKATRQLSNPARLGALKHKIAQVLTVLREHELKGEIQHV